MSQFRIGCAGFTLLAVVIWFCNPEEVTTTQQKPLEASTQTGHLRLTPTLKGEQNRLLPLQQAPFMAVEEPAIPSSSQFGEGVKTIKLHSGLDMPSLGYGTCCRQTARGKAVVESTVKYLQAGGHLIDTAMAYRNHKEIGEALRKSGVSRKSIWLTSKISPSLVKSRTDTVKACDNILTELGVDYLDLLLIHSPKLGREKTVELWMGLIDLKASGKVRSIGVSNMNFAEISDLEAATGVVPEVNQIQFHPWSPRQWKELVANLACEKDIVTTAYTSLGGSRFRGAGSQWGGVISRLAAKHQVSEAQVLLQWALQQNVAVIPGSSSEEHIRENLLTEKNFTLDQDDIEAIRQAPAPKAWFDPKRGPAKMAGKEAEIAWM